MGLDRVLHNQSLILFQVLRLWGTLSLGKNLISIISIATICLECSWAVLICSLFPPLLSLTRPGVIVHEYCMIIRG